MAILSMTVMVQPGRLSSMQLSPALAASSVQPTKGFAQQ
jgi:hypothetical protein